MIRHCSLVQWYINIVVIGIGIVATTAHNNTFHGSTFEIQLGKTLFDIKSPVNTLCFNSKFALSSVNHCGKMSKHTGYEANADVSKASGSLAPIQDDDKVTRVGQCVRWSVANYTASYSPTMIRRGSSIS